MGFRKEMRRQRAVHLLHNILCMSILVYMMLLNEEKCKNAAWLGMAKRMAERLCADDNGGLMKTMEIIWSGGP